MKNNYSKRLMDVLEYSREEASRLLNSYIGPEHLMLGIIREGEGKAVQIMHKLNIDDWEIKKQIEKEIKNTIESDEINQQNPVCSRKKKQIRNICYWPY